MRSITSIRKTVPARRAVAGLFAAAMLVVAMPCAARPALGAAGIDSPTNYPGAPKPVYDDVKAPYAMNYADEAGQRLGVRDGKMDIFSTQRDRSQPFVPVFSGGLGGDGAMLRLRWHPGD